jgi:hypothetical protein
MLQNLVFTTLVQLESVGEVPRPQEHRFTWHTVALPVPDY